MKIPWENIKKEIEEIKNSKIVLFLVLMIMWLVYITMFNPFGWFTKK